MIAKPPFSVVLHRRKYNRNSIAALGGILLSPAGKTFVGSVLVANTVTEVSTAPAGSLHLVSYPLWHLRESLELLQMLRDMRPDERILAGGPGPAGEPDATLAAGFDHVFVGPAEASLPEFFRILARGGSPAKILPAPPPDPQLFDRFDGIAPDLNLFGPLEITRGCFCRCGFCGVPSFSGGRVIHRSPAAAERICRLAVRHGRRRTWVVSPNALSYGLTTGGRTPDLSALEELLLAMKRAGMTEIFFGSFPSEIGPELVTADALALLRRHCANRLLTIGGQSGSDRVLRRMGRAHRATDVLHAADIARRSGFIPHLDILWGSPGETDADRAQTRELILRFFDGGEGRIHQHYFMPLPASPWANERPAPLDEETQSFIHQMIRGGRADGWVQRQLRAGTETGSRAQPPKSW